MKSSVKAQKAPIGKRLVKFWPLYVMLVPCIIYYILIKYVPMAGLLLAFKDYSYKKGIFGSPWVGWRYFETFFTSYDCLRLIKNTLVVGLIKCILEFPFAIILALMLNQVRFQRFKRITQTVLYAPHFISVMVVCGMIKIFLSPSGGLLNLIAGTSIDFLTESCYSGKAAAGE